MLQRVLERAYRRMGARYPDTLLRVEEQTNYLIVFLAIAVLTLYVEMSTSEFVRLYLVGALMTLVYTIIYPRVATPVLAPVRAWLQGQRSPNQTREAWHVCAAFPREMLRRELSPRSLGLWVVAVNLGWCAYATWELGFPAYAVPLLFIGVLAYIAYTLILRFLLIEQILRPVLADIAPKLPDEAPEPPGVPLRWRLLAALPAINVFSGVVATGLASTGPTDFGDLAVAVGASVLVAATVSLLLILLLSDSITTPVSELRKAAASVGRGDFDVRVPVLTTDETGELTRSFNQMAAGLGERERIRETFGAYVDPEVAEHILREGTSLEGEQVEVTMLFLDIRDFTGYAERAEAPQVVATLNRLWELVVPLIHQHGGHVDKFVGDGLLAVFGAPRRSVDHADQALAAALAIASAVREEFDSELAVGIGLNSGRVVAGNVGGGGRLEFSVIGDAVNVAARVEAATRETGDVVLLAERTKALLQGGDVSLEERPNVDLKGKRESVKLFAPESR
jgi:class 3 adenylate cyclase